MEMHTRDENWDGVIPIALEGENIENLDAGVFDVSAVVEASVAAIATFGSPAVDLLALRVPAILKKWSVVVKL